ncbi:GDSL-type esterase/lipase family protein [uncultured Ilyobacter sp.]|uniref:GDSL-type esterase/lipase family protein n=1 Tax=uncultured Ilyobacter sp. TaxID=544433 RepID=UPI0029C70AC4|nr:GDSL-type esterase/lipase family protein [uncultured Ilyobacter sp.]
MKKTIMLGDSITEWNPLIDKNIINMGVAGDTTRDIFWRIDEVKSIEADKVVLMAGINDILMRFPIEKVYEFYKKIVSSLKENFEEIMLLGVLPIEGDDEINMKISQVNSFIEGLEEKNRVCFFDFSKSLFDEEFSLNSSFYTDGLHLSYEGYESLNKEILKLLSL